MMSPDVSEGYTNKDFLFSKLHKAVSEAGGKTLSDAAKAMYAECEGSENGTLPLNRYFREKLRWKSNKIKSKIGKMQQELLEKNINEIENFDVSFACKVIDEACYEILNRLPDTCRNSIDRAKSLRNKVCHMYGFIEDKDHLKNEFERLEKDLMEIYEEVDKVTTQDLREEAERMRKSLSVILEAEYRQDIHEIYLKELEEIKKTLNFHMITNGRTELKESYEKLGILNPCTWLFDPEIRELSVSKFDVEKIFTPLKIEDSKHEIDMKNLLITTKKINGEDRIPSILFLHGLAGCGKTSLCKYLLQDWYKKKREVEGLIKFDLVFFVEVRKVHSSGLSKYLREQRFEETCSTIKEGDIIPTLKALDVLFVIDGYDEACHHDDGDAIDIVKEIFLEFGANHRIILTTRPEFLPDAIGVAKRNGWTNILPVEICGFDEPRLREYTVKVFQAVEQDERKCKRETGKFLDYISGKGRILNDHLKLPLTIALLIYLWRDDPQSLNEVTTATLLYKKLFELCQKKLRERMAKYFMPLDKLDKVLDGLFHFLSKQAWLMLKENYFVIADKFYDEIVKECKKENVKAIQLMSAYLMCESEEDRNLDDEGNENIIFSFLHKTQMEYLAGRYLSKCVAAKEQSLSGIENECRNWRPFQEVLKFFVGHLAIEKELGRNNIEGVHRIIKKAGIQAGDYNFWWSVFSESMCNNGMGSIAIKELPFENWKLNDTNVISGLRLLIYTPVQLKTMHIDIPSTVEPHDIKDFLPIMKSLRKKITVNYKRYDKNNAIQLELHLWHHIEEGCEKVSNEFIKTLSPWGHLINFTGGLSEQAEGTEVLNFSFKMKNARIKLNSVKAIASLGRSLKKIHKSIRHLRITLSLPFNCATDEISQLTCSGDLEVFLSNVSGQHLNWLKDVVTKVGGTKGCYGLHLQRSELKENDVRWLLDHMVGRFHSVSIVQSKMCIQTFHDISDEKREELMALAEDEYYFRIEWL